MRGAGSTTTLTTMIWRYQNGKNKFDLRDYLGGLHCGQCFDVKLGGKWIPTRIEMGEDWYLVGIKVHDLRGLVVRI